MGELSPPVVEKGWTKKLDLRGNSDFLFFCLNESLTLVLCLSFPSLAYFWKVRELKRMKRDREKREREEQERYVAGLNSVWFQYLGG